MKRSTSWLAALALVAAMGCSRGARRATAVPAAPDAGSPVAPGDGGALTDVRLLTPAKLEAFIRFEQIQGHSEAEALDALAPLLDAGVKGLTPESPVFQVMRHRASDDEAARKASGLSEEEIRYISGLVDEVLTKRAFAKTFDFRRQIEQLKAIRDRLPPKQRASQDKLIEHLEDQQRRFSDLSEERQRFGDHNVDLVLQYENQLTALH